MLTGEFRHTLDTKGRVFVPAKFRADLGERVVISRSLRKDDIKFLVMYSEEGWINFMKKMDNPEFESNPKFIAMKRYIMKYTMPTDIDSQGRIVIGTENRDFAALDKEISFIGMTDHVEIWNSSLSDEEADTYDLDDFVELGKQLRLGLN